MRNDSGVVFDRERVASLGNQLTTPTANLLPAPTVTVALGVPFVAGMRCCRKIAILFCLIFVMQN